MAQPRALIDARTLPDIGFDARSLLWWGNLLLVLIETTSMVVLFATYFYIRRNFWEWPPPLVNSIPPKLEPVPVLPVATVNAILMLLACAPMYWTDMAARRKDTRRTLHGLLLMIAVTIVCCLLRWREFYDIYFKWSDNAYASAVWCILGMHLFYLLTILVEFILAASWCATHELQDKHALDVTLIGGFWYWVAGIWAISYVIVWWYPRWS
jgi:cytochrome c oxidase subunit III